jgi:hypothetical protein
MDRRVGRIAMKTPEDRLSAYEVDVQDPEVSGMEHLEMLFNRSELAKIESALSTEQKVRLEAADQALLRQAQQFCVAIESIANLQQWREHKGAPSSHWWWYLDVLAAAPVAATELARA